MLLSRSLILSTALSLGKVSEASVLARQSDITGACTCQVTKCEHTVSVQGCDSPITFGVSTANFCLINGGNQWLYDSYDDYVHERSPTVACGSDTGSVSTSCTCSTYAGSNLGNLTVTTYPTNAAGYVTDPNYYGSTVPSGPCYCDIYSTTGGGKDLFDAEQDQLPPIGYYSLGTPSQPVFCSGNDGILDQEGGDFLATCGFADNGNGLVTPQNFCQCAVATQGSTTGTVINGTLSVVESVAHSDLIAAVHAGSGGSGGRGVTHQSDSGSASASVSAPWVAFVLGVTALSTF